MLSRLILASVAVGAVSLRPRSRLWAGVALGAGAASAALAGKGVARGAAEALWPMLAFLTIALAAAAWAERAGVAERLARSLAAAGGGRTLRLYALVCATSALLTAVVSLDGAVVLMVPVVRSVTRRCGVAVGPFYAGAVAVANAASLAVPEGNPTNLVVMSRLGVSPNAFLAHLLLPGLCAAAFCALVPLRRLGPSRYRALSLERPDAEGRLLPVPWRIGAQMAGLLGTLDGLVPTVSLHGHGLAALLAVAAGTGAASALANNLPVSASVAALATAGPRAHPAPVGPSVG